MLKYEITKDVNGSITRALVQDEARAIAVFRESATQLIRLGAYALQADRNIEGLRTLAITADDGTWSIRIRQINTQRPYTAFMPPILPHDLEVWGLVFARSPSEFLAKVRTMLEKRMHIMTTDPQFALAG